MEKKYRVYFENDEGESVEYNLFFKGKIDLDKFCKWEVENNLWRLGGYNWSYSKTKVEPIKWIKKEIAEDKDDFDEANRKFQERKLKLK